MNKGLHISEPVHNNRSVIFMAALSILLGGIIYLAFRSPELAFIQWIGASGSDGWLALFRENAASYGKNLPEWFVYSLPDGLWAFAYALVITSIWTRSSSWIKYLWLASIPLLIIGFEAMQYLHIIPGTFCFQDLIAGLAGLTLGYIIGTNTQKHRKHEKEMV